MAISLRPISVLGTDSNRTQRLFAQLVFSGSYSTGGDNTITYDTTDTPSYTKGFLETLMVGASQPPVVWAFSVLASAPEFTFDLVAGTGAFDFKVKTFQATLAPTIQAGTITLTAGSGTATVPSGSVAVVTDQSATGNTYKAAVSGTTLTVTSSSGTDTGTISYIAVVPATQGLSTAELAAGAYPAALTGATDVFVLLQYKSNI